MTIMGGWLMFGGQGGGSSDPLAVTITEAAEVAVTVENAEASATAELTELSVTVQPQESIVVEAGDAVAEAE